MERRYFSLLDELTASPDVRAIVLTGAGSSFCPGMDMAALADTAAVGELNREGRRPMHTAMSVPKPMIAAINGACAGIGLIQAMYCDVRFVAGTARMSTSFTRRGLGAEYGTSWMLPRLIGVERALDLLLSGRVFDGEEAHRLGLASRAVRGRHRCRRGADLRARARAVFVAACDGRGPPPGLRRPRRRLRRGLGAWSGDHARDGRASRTSARASPASRRSGTRNFDALPEGFDDTLRSC